MRPYALFLAAVLALVSCARNPVTGKRELAISEDKELALGAQNHPAILQQMGVYEDDDLDALLQRVGTEMAAKSHRPDLDWTFTMVDSDVVNAFAVPGGYVYFTRGILAHFNNEAEFAGVLGHEIGHVTARHSAQQLRKQQLAQVGMIAGALASNTVRQNFEAVNQGMQLLFLKYGRDAESESDQLGVEYSSQLGYDATYMAGFFQTIDRLQRQSGQEVPDFLSTHPDPLNREARVRELAGEWAEKLPGEQDDVGRADYLRLIDGMIYGEDPAQGYTEGQTFYHPVLEFSFDYPRGWQLVNSPTQVQMGSPKQDAVVSFTLEQAANPEAAAQAWMEANQVQAQRGGAETINGLSAYRIEGVAATGQQGGQQQEIAWVVTFVELDGQVYSFTGLTLASGARANAAALILPANSFGELTDPSYLNRQPERVRIASVAQPTTLKSFLSENGTSGGRLDELAILNGMALDAQLPSGTLVKLIE